MTSTQPGHSFPIGSTYSTKGVNFSLFSKHAEKVDLLFFDSRDEAEPSIVFHLDPTINKTYHYWHIFIRDVQPGQYYGYRVWGPYDPARGMRFDPSKTLLDPYAKAVAFSPSCPKSVVVNIKAYD